MKIVIVEDEVRIREGIHRLLTKTDPSFEVVGEAENGREGIELLLRERPDLALVDVRMPELDGIGMLEAVQAQGFKPMVIVLSAYSDFSYAQQAMKLGAREYLVKPIVVDELIGAVRRAKEALAQQTLARSGMRARGDVLSAALYANVPLSSEALEQVHRTFDLGENTPFALLMVHLADDTGFPAAERIAAFLQTHLGGECTILPQAMQGCIACVFTGFDGMLARTLEKKLLCSWKTDVRFVAGLDFCTGLSGLRKTALHMLSLMEYGLILPAGRLVRPQEIAELGLEVLSYPIETENAARAALAKHDADTVPARLRDFGTFFENGVLYAPREIKEAHVRFALSLLGIAQELGRGEDGRLSRQALLDDVMSAVHPSQLASVRRRLADFLCEDAVEERETGLLVRRARGLMQTFFSQGITLEEIARKLGVTPEYLGTQIHRETGMTFGTLMKQLRVDEARRLFLTTDKKLYEVARMVGYSDAKYFSKVFQSITGMLPAEYRRMNK